MSGMKAANIRIARVSVVVETGATESDAVQLSHFNKLGSAAARAIAAHQEAGRKGDCVWRSAAIAPETV